VITARDGAELEEAASELRADGARVTAIAGDITADDMPQVLVGAAVEQYGRLDILVSNAGVIQVGPVEDSTLADFEAAMRTMAMAPIRLSLTALPVMRRQEHGRIVTITSIGGKVSVPHLLPYGTAKFAAVGFSEGLRAELGRAPIAVTTVVPGLMRTGSHLRAQFTGRREEELTWFGLGASLPVVSMDAERAARQIVEAVRGRRPEVILTPLGQMAARAAGVVPGLTAGLLHAVRELVLPPPAGEQVPAAPGRALEPAIGKPVFDWLTTLGRRAALRFRQHPDEPASAP
jgi:short-subunit dehydrogenase